MITLAARTLSTAVDVAAWALERFADVAEPAGHRLTRAADTARWLAHASRCVP